MSLIDVVVGTALMLIIFLGLTALLRTSLKVSAIAKARSIATTIGGSQMEMVRSISYNSVGTIAGIPAGTIPQNTVYFQNGTSFLVRTYIQYYDDGADGFGALDSNGITTDYKIIKITVTYTAGGSERSLDFHSKYAPPGLETTSGGGTLKFEIVNAAGLPVPGASVRIVNASSTPTIDVTTFSDILGTVFLPGAATSSEYQAFISKGGYSSAQTYKRDIVNQNPTPGYFTVAQDVTTSGTFSIDVLARLLVNTFLPIATSTWSDTFIDSTGVASIVNAEVSLGSVVLAGGSGAYVPSGEVSGVTITPNRLNSWVSASTTQIIPANTTSVFRVLDGSGTPVPDADLPGNSLGFTMPVDLQSLSTTTYPTLALKANLTSGDVTATPELTYWGISYRTGPTPLPNVDFSLLGAKTIGTTGSGSLLYKTSIGTTTDSGGVRDITLEWDLYQLEVPGYDVIEICNAPPYQMDPGITTSSNLMIASSTPNAVLVSVRDITGALGNATVTLTRAGFNQTVATTLCGSAYFGSVPSASDYTITISKAGYTSAVVTGVSISGHVFFPSTLEI